MGSGIMEWGKSLNASEQDHDAITSWHLEEAHLHPADGEAEGEKINEIASVAIWLCLLSYKWRLEYQGANVHCYPHLLRYCFMSLDISTMTRN
jgi:hypothetical protein